MESNPGQLNKAPIIFRQSSATQPGGTGRVSSAKQPPGTSATTVASVERTSQQQPSPPSARISSAQFQPTKHISTATQPPSHSTSTMQTHTKPGSEGPSDAKDSPAPIRNSNMQQEDAKPNRVSDIIYALAQSTLTSTKSDQRASFKKEAKVEQSASAIVALEEKLSTPKSPTPSDKVEVSLRDGRLTFTECFNEGSTDDSSQVTISQRIAAMEKSATTASNGSVVTHITSAADPPTNRSTFRRNENAEILEFIPGKTAPSLPLLPPKSGSNRPKISLPPTPSENDQPSSPDIQPSPKTDFSQPPPIPSRKVSLTPTNEHSLARNPAALPAARPTHLPVSDRPLPPTPPNSDPRPSYTNRPPVPLPTNRDNNANQRTMKTATLPPVNLKPPLSTQSKTNTLPPRFRIKDPTDTTAQQNTQVKSGEQYDTVVYEQVDGDVQSRISKIEDTQLKLRSVLQKEQNDVLDEVKRLSASVEHLKTWTLRCQEMLISDTTKCQESVESLKVRSNEITRLLREHIIQISQDVSKASEHIFQVEATKEHLDNRVMHVFDWNLQLQGGSEKTVTSQPYHIKEINISLTGAAQFSRDGSIYLKVIGDSDGKMQPGSELSGNFTCKVCITDASDTMPDWGVGKVMGNLFKDSEWVAGTVSVSEVKDKSYCAEGKTFKVKYAIDLYK